MKTGVIGLGNLGGKLAGSLLRNGFELAVHDLDRTAATALCTPPETGQSTAAAPFAATRAAIRLISAASVVDISSQILPGASPARTPSSASITAADAAGLGRQVMIRSHVLASA